VERLRLSRLLRRTTELLPPNANILDALSQTPRDEVIDLPDNICLNDDASGPALLNLLQVMHNSLVPQLVATPLVYIGTSWKLQSHSKFRARKRKELEAMIDLVKTKKDVDYSKIIQDFQNILLEVFQVRLPAMPDYYANDNSFVRLPVQKVSSELCNKIHAARKLEFKDNVNALATILIQWYTYCPVGRPHVYLSDDHWTMVSERELRKYYRQQIASQIFT